MKTRTHQENLDDLAKEGTCIEFFSAYQDMDLGRMLLLFDTTANVVYKTIFLHDSNRFS